MKVEHLNELNVNVIQDPENLNLPTIPSFSKEPSMNSTVLIYLLINQSYFYYTKSFWLYLVNLVNILDESSSKETEYFNINIENEKLNLSAVFSGDPNKTWCYVH